MLMEKVRSVTKYFMWFAAAAFVFSMAIGFGTTMFWKGGEEKENIIAEVDDEAITIKEYGDAVRSGLQRISGALGSDPIKERQMSESIINQLITDKIVNDLLQERGIAVSEDQIINLIRENPPAEIMQNPDFWIGEQFDYDRYFELLKDPRAGGFIRSYAAQIMQSLPMSILRGEVFSMARVTSGEAIEELLKDSVEVKIEYIKLPIKEWESEKISIEPKDFYAEHQEMFRQDYALKLGYVSFPIRIDDETVEVTEELANSVAERAKTDSFNLLVRKYSYFPENRALLSGWVKVGNLTHSFASNIAGIREGNISKPIKSKKGFHILKLEDRERDSVKIREIFLPLFPSYDDFQKSSQASWALVKKLRSDSVLSIPDGLDPEYISLGKGDLPDLPINFGTFLINPKEGDVSYPLIGEEAFYVFWVERKSEGIPPFSEIEAEVLDSLIKYEAAARAKEYAFSNFSGIKLPRDPGKGKWGRTPYFSFRNYSQFNIPEKIAYLALNMRKNVIFPPIRAGEYVYVVNQIDFKMPELKKIKEVVINTAIELQQSKESSYFQRWFYNKRKEYNIEDLREKIYE